MEPSQPPPARPRADAGEHRLRADAERNRERIVAAARAVFAESGERAPVSRVARRAGVGVATLYRRFPTREDLVEAACADQRAECHGALRRLEAYPDPWEAVRETVLLLCATQLRDRNFTARALAEVEAGRTKGLAEELGRLDAILARARVAGVVRRSVDRGDLCLLALGHAGVVAAAGRDPWPASRRYAELALLALRAQPPRAGSPA
ncbi:transcriptional regulator, TetR family [Streptomyces zhaozhouensis]|uniref:Transcriptional regulator, TetR family n=1 Tax=Streptomyces zhaozhouensis TaxID=1300267 RepID=A0A286E4C6_9ACTN|nr:TetR/AcrR family transcriptional regulator [Streptomyces zhaozhouensis]SOD65767.1 transcriptional regulator, TetR family [Streptomyces zhaozhouensis]